MACALISSRGLCYIVFYSNILGLLFFLKYLIVRLTLFLINEFGNFYRCDNLNDCRDKSDEANCKRVIPFFLFQKIQVWYLQLFSRLDFFSVWSQPGQNGSNISKVHCASAPNDRQHDKGNFLFSPLFSLLALLYFPMHFGNWLFLREVCR